MRFPRTVPERAPATPETAERRRHRDAGAALPLVLVMMVIGSLIVIPTMKYSISVMRANSVLSTKTKRLESVKSGLRVALADPVNLYDVCDGGPTLPTALAPVTINGIEIKTRCHVVDQALAHESDELRYGVTATQAGLTPPAELKGTAYVPTDPASTTEWLTETSVLSETSKIWLPNLATHGLNLRASSGTTMPAGFPTCNVFFPGTYIDPVLLDGPTYFTSGVYYFENEVRVVGGADVVVGMGATPGCTDDQEAIFYAENAPGTHNMSGLGATWIFGDQARLVVTNENASSLEFRFNTRYVPPDDPGVAPSADVSIMTVNGELSGDGSTGVDLLVPDTLEVPVSVVGADSPVNAVVQDYLPSLLTPKPTAPEAPTDLLVQRFHQGAVVDWTASFDNGSPVTGYVATASSGHTCATAGSTTCVFTGLSNGSSVTFAVVATNDVGDSSPSDPSSSVSPGGTTYLYSPSQPAAPAAVPYEAAARVTWAAPANGGAIITGYAVTASPGGQSCTVDMTTADPPLLECDVEGLDPNEIPGYTFTVVATNALGSSTPSAASAPEIIAAVGLGDPPEPPEPPEPPFFAPVPVIDIDLPDTAAVSIAIPSYISVPQGRLYIDNPHGLDVVITGGILAAQYDGSDARASGPQSVPIGFVPAIVQRKFQLYSWSDDFNESSSAIVQVNDNGAYAVNSWVVQ